MEQYIDVEFELNDDADVDEDLNLKFNSFEDVEINIDGFIVNDVGADDLSYVLLVTVIFQKLQHGKVLLMLEK